MKDQEMVTISIDRYSKLMESEKEVEEAKRLLEMGRRELSQKVKNLYTVDYIEKNKELYVKIDKLNLLGLLGLNFKKEDEVRRVYFEFEERGIFLDERKTYGW